MALLYSSSVIHLIEQRIRIHIETDVTFDSESFLQLLDNPKQLHTFDGQWSKPCWLGSVRVRDCARASGRAIFSAGWLVVMFGLIMLCA